LRQHLDAVLQLFFRTLEGDFWLSHCLQRAIALT